MLINKTEKLTHPKLQKELDELYPVVPDSIGQRNVAHPGDGIWIRPSFQQHTSHRHCLLRAVQRQAPVKRSVTSNTRKTLRGALEGVGPEYITPSNAPSNDGAALKTIKYKHNKNNRYIGSFMYPGAVVYCCCVLLCVRGVRRSPCSCVV